MVEMADIVAVNKTMVNDWILQKSEREYYNALHLFPPKESGWAPKKVELCSAVENTGMKKFGSRSSSFLPR
ncbi:MAG: hypothetical protein R2784_13045 [Saprospiraceae bacterium]